MAEIGGIVNNPIPNLVGEKEVVKLNKVEQNSSIIVEQSLAQVLEQLEIPKEEIYEKIAKNLLAYKQPLQKEVLEQIKTLLQQLTGNTDDNLDLMAFLKSKDIPLSKDLVRELQKNLTEKNLGTLFDKLTKESELPILKDIWGKIPLKTQEKLVELLNKMTKNTSLAKPEKQNFIQEMKDEILTQNNAELAKATDKLQEPGKKNLDDYKLMSNKENKTILTDKTEVELKNEQGVKSMVDKPDSKVENKDNFNLTKKEAPIIKEGLADKSRPEIFSEKQIRETLAEKNNMLKENVSRLPEQSKLVNEKEILVLKNLSENQLENLDITENKTVLTNKAEVELKNEQGVKSMVDKPDSKVENKDNFNLTKKEAPIIKEGLADKSRPEIFSEKQIRETLAEKNNMPKENLSRLPEQSKLVNEKEILVLKNLSENQLENLDITENKTVLTNKAEVELKNEQGVKSMIDKPDSKVENKDNFNLTKKEAPIIKEGLADKSRPEIFSEKQIRETLAEKNNMPKENLSRLPEQSKLVNEKEILFSKNIPDNQLKNPPNTEKNLFLLQPRQAEQLSQELGKLYDLFSEGSEILPKEVIRERLGDLLDKTGEQLKEFPQGKEILKDLQNCLFKEKDILQGDFRALKDIMQNKKDTVVKLEQMIQRSEGTEKEVLVKVLQDFKTTMETENLLKFQQLSLLINTHSYQAGIKVTEDDNEAGNQDQKLRKIVLQMETSKLGEVSLNLGLADNKYLYLSFGVENETIGHHLENDFSSLQEKLKGLDYQVDEINYQVKNKGTFLELLLNDEKVEKMPDLQKVDILT